MAITLQQLFTQHSELANPANWKRVTPKAYEAYITMVPEQVTVHNHGLSAKVEVPALRAIVCRPYKDIRVGLSIDNFVDSEGRSGQALIQAHAKRHCINGSHEPKQVLPWTKVTFNKQTAPVLLAVRLDSIAIHNVIIQTPVTDKQFNGAPVMANNTLHTHKSGFDDYLVAEGVSGPNGTYIPNLNTIDVISGRTFTEMFDMRAFAGQNVPTDGDALTKPAELVEFTSLVKKSSYELVNKLAKNFGIKVELNDKDKATMEATSLPVDENDVPLLNEEAERKTLRTSVTCNFISADGALTLRVVVKTYNDIKQLMRGVSNRATIFSKTKIENVAHGGEYKSITSLLAKLGGKQ